MTYQEAIDFLEQSKAYGSKLGLETITILLECLGNPQDQLKFIHVGGTNGKGSTSAYISTILCEAGYVVGKYSSPVVFHPHENIQILNKNDQVEEHSNGYSLLHYISEEGFTSCMEQIQRACSYMIAEQYSHPTTFEIETAIAFLYFLHMHCDIVVLEVGLGGRLDATNVIKTVECVVLTSISMDHTQYLGENLGKITKEKVGIIKKGVPVVSYDQKEEALRVIKETCKEKQASLIIADFGTLELHSMKLSGSFFSYQEFGEMSISLLGKNQIRNASVALSVISVLQEKGYCITQDHVRLGLCNTIWKGRFELVQRKPIRIIDGAHNIDAAKELANNIETYFPNKKIYLIMGVFADKDYKGILKEMGYLADTILTITPKNARALSSSELAKEAQLVCSKVIDAENITNAFHFLSTMAESEDVVICFGSLSFLNESIEHHSI